MMLFCAERLDAAKMQLEQIEAIVNGTMKAIRGHPRIRPHAPVVVAIEGCSGDSLYMPRLFRGYPDVIVMEEVSNGRKFGTPKDATITKDMVIFMHVVLSLGLISIPSDAVALSTGLSNRPAKTMHDYREQLMAQFANFRLDASTGKIHGKAHGRNDDLIITFLMAPFWLSRFCSSINENYLVFRQNYPAGIWVLPTPDGILAERSRKRAATSGAKPPAKRARF